MRAVLPLLLGPLLLAALLACGPREDHAPPVTASPKLKAFYLANCAGCHTHTSKRLPSGAPMPGFYHRPDLDSVPDQALADTILQGRRGSIMPDFQGRLSPAEALELVQGLIRPLSRRAASREHAFWEPWQKGGTPCTERCL